MLVKLNYPWNIFYSLWQEYDFLFAVNNCLVNMNVSGWYAFLVIVVIFATIMWVMINYSYLTVSIYLWLLIGYIHELLLMYVLDISDCLYIVNCSH